MVDVILDFVLVLKYSAATFTTRARGCSARGLPRSKTSCFRARVGTSRRGRRHVSSFIAMCNCRCAGNDLGDNT